MQWYDILDPMAVTSPLRGGATLWAGNANPEGQSFFPPKQVYFISMRHLLLNHLDQLVLATTMTHTANMTHKGIIYIDDLTM